MTLPCPNCSGVGVVTSYRKHLGIKRRGYTCRECQFRWTDCSADPEAKGIFTEENIREILESSETHRTLAAKYDCHHNAISLIRRGRSYRNVAPEIPRWTKDITCHSCIHWDAKGCTLGHEDPIEEGIRFARFCSCYQVKP